MNLNPLFPKQKQLDQFITKEKKLKEEHTLDKIIALSVELGELLNEFPTLFKFWADKSNDRELGLVEFVDSVHFALSIANDLGYEAHKYTKTVPKDLRFTYLGLQNVLSLLAVNPEVRLLKTLFDHLITFGYQLGFTEKQVIEAYSKKHEENYARQKNGY